VSSATKDAEPHAGSTSSPCDSQMPPRDTPGAATAPQFDDLVRQQLGVDLGELLTFFETHPEVPTVDADGAAGEMLRASVDEAMGNAGLALARIQRLIDYKRSIEVRPAIVEQAISRKQSKIASRPRGSRIKPKVKARVIAMGRAGDKLIAIQSATSVSQPTIREILDEAGVARPRGIRGKQAG
jgi:hypothetical protein